MSKASDLAVRLGRSYSILLRGLTWRGSDGDDPYRAFSATFDPKVKPE